MKSRAYVLRIQKTLEDANLKLTQVMSNIAGVSGRAVLRGLIAGETDPDRLADLTRGRLKATHGRITDHHSDQAMRQQVRDPGGVGAHDDLIDTG